MTDIKEWTIGSGKTAVHLVWMSDNPDVVVSTNESGSITDKQFDMQSDRIKESVEKFFGCDVMAPKLAVGINTFSASHK